MQWSMIGTLEDLNVLAALKMASLKAHEMANIFEVIAFLKHLDPLYLELVRLV